MNFQNINFITSAINKDGYPDLKSPEIMIWGKSNVGKSSFINSLTENNKISKVSSSPGKTKTINFFNLDNKITLVDMPGYGYALVSKVLRQKFLTFIFEYVKERKNLKFVIFLLDSRHKPTDMDLEMLNKLLKLKLNVLIVATKWDKLNQSQKASSFKNFNERLKLEKDDYLQTSSLKNIGFDKVRKFIKQIK